MCLRDEFLREVEMCKLPVVELGQLVKILKPIHGVPLGEYGVVVREFMDGSVLVLNSQRREVARYYRADLEVTDLEVNDLVG